MKWSKRISNQAINLPKLVRECGVKLQKVTSQMENSDFWTGSLCQSGICAYRMHSFAKQWSLARFHLHGYEFCSLFESPMARFCPQNWGCGHVPWTPQVDQCIRPQSIGNHSINVPSRDCRLQRRAETCCRKPNQFFRTLGYISTRGCCKFRLCCRLQNWSIVSLRLNAVELLLRRLLSSPVRPPGSPPAAFQKLWIQNYEILRFRNECIWTRCFFLSAHWPQCTAVDSAGAISSGITHFSSFQGWVWERSDSDRNPTSFPGWEGCFGQTSYTGKRGFFEL